MGNARSQQIAVKLMYGNGARDVPTTRLTQSAGAGVSNTGLAGCEPAMGS